MYINVEDIVGAAKYNLSIDVGAQERRPGSYLKEPPFREEWNKHSSKWAELIPVFCYWVIDTLLNNILNGAPGRDPPVTDAIDWLRTNT